MTNNKWNSVYIKENPPSGKAEVHKLAASDGFYIFCVSNLDSSTGTFRVNYQVGLELMQLEMLPNKSDSENLDRQLKFLNSQKNKLGEQADHNSQLNFISRQLNHTLGAKMIVFAILGMLIIMGVNVGFYFQLKKTFKDRKLI